MPRRRKPPKLKNSVENKMVADLDAYARFQDFKNMILPQLQKDVMAGLPAEKLYEKYQHMAAARAITIAASDPDSGKALAAIKDILDRSAGKPTEKKEVTHKYADLKDEELQALLETELADLEDEELEETEDTEGDGESVKKD